MGGWRMAGRWLADGRLGDAIHPDLYIDEYVRIRACMAMYIWPCSPVR
jgi:hypothetical protein